MIVASGSIALAVALLAVAPLRDGVPIPDGPTLGWDARTSDSDELAAAIPEALRGRVVVRLTVSWSEVETASGVYEWRAVRAAVEPLHAAGARVALCLTGGHPGYVPGGGLPSPFVPGSIEGFAAWARSAVRELGDFVQVYEVWDRPFSGSGPTFEPVSYAFLLKTVSVAVRAEARERGRTARVSQGAIAESDLDTQRALWASDAAPYVDVLPVLGGVDVARVVAESAAFPPAPELWLRAEGQEPGRAVGEALTALSRGAAVAIVPSEGAIVAVESLQKLLDTGFAPAPADSTSISPEPGRVLARFFNDRTFEAAVVFEAGAAASGSTSARLQVPSEFVRQARVLEPWTADERRASVNPGRDGGREVAVPVGPLPAVLVYQAAVPVPGGIEVDPERLEVERTRGLTAEEIVAQYREVQKRQDDRFERLQALGRVDLHFQLTEGGALIDVGIESRYFLERGGSLEWEELEYFVNGNRVRWKNMPELPLIQPEKVVTLPLDLTLDRTYAYRLEGEEAVDGRPCYVLSFEPGAGKTDALYRGRVWIDRESFVRRKASVVQLGLEAPVLQNEEIDRYQAVTGPDGFEYWLLTAAEGQQVWSVAGRTFVVKRDVRFRDIVVNPPFEAFEADRARAYASDNAMLRDTAEGFRYLERTADGGRQVKSEVDSSQWFATVGAFRDAATDGVVPLAGVNWFDYDLAGRNIQANVLFAGVFLFGTVSYPDLFERKVSATLDVTASALAFDDKVYVSGDEVLAERIESRNQSAALRIGVPLGPFVALNLIGDFDFRSFGDTEEGRDARPEGTRFVLPPDHRLTTLSAELRFNRRGFNVCADAGYSSRSEWAPWGLYDESSGAYLDEEYDPSQRSFLRYRAGLFKEWNLPKFQKVRAEASWLAGSDLDRFSRFEFSFFGDDRLNGYSGSGVKFDRGAIARAGYTFNVFEAVRFDAALDAAWVEDLSDPAGWQNFAGIGLSGQVVGPWKTIVNLNYGYGLTADIEDVEGRHEFLLLIFKLF